MRPGLLQSIGMSRNRRSPWGADMSGILDDFAPYLHTDHTKDDPESTGVPVTDSTGGKVKHGSIPVPARVVDYTDTYELVRKLMETMGLSPDVADWATAQAAFETGGFKSNVAKRDNNFSGIKYINKPYQKKATKGVKSNDGGYYAHFPSWQDWAMDFYRILHLGGDRSPANATTLDDYVSRLKANRYFGASEKAYKAGLVKYMSDKKVSTELVTAPNPVKNWWSDLPMKYKIGGGVALALVAVVAVRRK